MVIIINGKKLSHNEIEHVVNEWYTNGMYAGILQDEEGSDLEEILGINYEEEVESFRDAEDYLNMELN